ncbi:MAG: SufD family Fe-S cluster assembly protein [Candidatus Thermoplasmatota archaeon]
MNKNEQKLASDLSKVADVDVFNNSDIAHIFIHHHDVVRSHDIPGLNVETEEMKDQVKIKINVDPDVKIEHPVHMCFGMMIKEGDQKLVIDIDIGENSEIDILAHCAFPNAENIRHMMDAEIDVGKNASYSYFERHIHGESGGVEVIPKADINLEENASFYSEFELLKGRAGLIDIDYETNCAKDSVLEMVSRINAKKEDVVKIREIGHLNGDNSRGFLNSRVAARGKSKAEVYNKLTASGSYARGHVDCKEIIQDEATVGAIPIVEVSNPKAHITHEASLGSVDSKQLQTLMSRGLSEDEATELIIQGLLSRK